MRSVFLKRLSVKLIILLLLFSSASFPGVISGTGFTKDAALNNALINALENKIESYISERVFIENNQLFKREFIDNVSRYILSSKVISTEESFGCIRVEAEFDIDNVTLKNNLIARGFTVKSVIKPSIIILIDEHNDNNKMPEHTARLALKEVLIENGYTILDVTPEAINTTNSSSSYDVTSNDFAHFGFENNADLVIRGLVNTGKATPVDVYGNKQLTVPVQMNIEVIRTDNTQIIASNTVNLRKNATNEYSALQLALKSAAKETGGNIAAKLNTFCESENYTERHFELVIDGLNYTQADKLESDITKISCIKNVTLRYLEKQRAVYGISINGSMTELRKEISSGKIPGLSIESLTGGRIFAVYGKDSLQTISQPAYSDVEISSFFIEELYPSKSRYYATHPAGKLSLSSSVPVSDIQLSLSLPELLKEPFQKSINHFDAVKNDIDLYIVPAYEKLINIVQTRTFQGQLVLQYTTAGTTHARSLSIPVTIYGINGMNWDHPEAISSFITNDDPAIRTFSRQAVQNLTYVNENNQDLVNAIALHAAILKYGIQYVKDPSPASDKLIDMVQYPAQTFFSRTGDCDDLSVLYCALLSSIGIPVALLLYDDHVCFMFNTGIYEKNRLALSPDTTLSIIHDKKLWIPVEATDMRSSFVENWHATARKFHEDINAGRNVQIIDIQDSWKHYPPTSLFTDKLDIHILPVKNNVESQLKNLLTVTNKQYVQEIARLKSIKKKDITDLATLKNKIGLLYVRSGDYPKALQYFKQAYHSNNSSKMQSNYACVLLLTGKEKEALKIFDTIYKDDAEGKIAVNRMFCKYIASQDTASIKDFYNCMLETISVIQSQANLSDILGFDIARNDSLRGSLSAHPDKAPKLDISIVTQNLNAALNTLKQHTISGVTTESSSGTRITGTTSETSTGTTADDMKQILSPFGGLRGASVEDLFRLIDLLYWFDF